MLAEIIYFDCAMLVLDIVTIADLRKFLIDFLFVKRSKKEAYRIFQDQTTIQKITLNFIKQHLKKYIREFLFYHRIYRVVLCTLVPQYILILLSNYLLQLKSLYVLGLFALLKLAVCVIVRMNVDSNRISIYRAK